MNASMAAHLKRYDGIREQLPALRKELESRGFRIPACGVLERTTNGNKPSFVFYAIYRYVHGSQKLPETFHERPIIYKREDMLLDVDEAGLDELDIIKL